MNFKIYNGAELLATDFGPGPITREEVIKSIDVGLKNHGLGYTPRFTRSLNSSFDRWHQNYIHEKFSAIFMWISHLPEIANSEYKNKPMNKEIVSLLKQCGLKPTADLKEDLLKFYVPCRNISAQKLLYVLTGKEF